MIYVYLEHIIAKNYFEIIKNKVFIAKNVIFNVFAIYSKRDIRVTTFFKSLITPPKMRLSTKSFREMKANEFRTITTALKF